MKIKSISKTKHGVAIMTTVNDEVLPLYIDNDTWAKTKRGNSIDELPDEMLVNSEIRVTDYKIVRKGDEWYSEYRDEHGVYESDKLKWSGAINIELDPQTVAVRTKNKILVQLVEEKLKDKLADEFESMLDRIL